VLVNYESVNFKKTRKEVVYTVHFNYFLLILVRTSKSQCGTSKTTCKENMLIATIQTRITFTCLDAGVECVTKEISELESQLYGHKCI
jgi:hypothetical protein